jgi:uncharacterized protein
MPGYIYAQDKSGIYVNLFVGSKARVQLGERKVILSQTTDYPWQGNVKIAVEPDRTSEFDLRIRIPGWYHRAPSPSDLYQVQNRPAWGGVQVKVNGKAVEKFGMVRGYATLHRKWKRGDVVELNLDMPVMRVVANEQVEAAKGRVALMRGPIVYCFEGTDNGQAVQNLVVAPETKFTPEFRKDLLGGVTVLNATGTAVFKSAVDKVAPEPFKVMAIPYYANANRGTCQMQVWMAENQEQARAQKQE